MTTCDVAPSGEYRWQLPTEVDQCMNRHLRPFCACDLHLDPMIFIYELDSYSLEIHRMCKYELATWRLSKVIFWQADIQTDRQTWLKLYTMKQRCIYTPHNFLGGQQCINQQYCVHIYLLFIWLSCFMKVCWNLAERLPYWNVST